MKEPLETRDVECPTCHARVGVPCTKPVYSAGRAVLGDHSARYRALTEARVTWEKWRRWHQTGAVSALDAGQRELRRHDEEQYRRSVLGDSLELEGPRS